ncbi:MAG TPA: hypothetical protein VMG08_18495 [Allosphingosinicella sp.]|nr:hypothetical protein [Allosphingosinicella sp.]
MIAGSLISTLVVTLVVGGLLAFLIYRISRARTGGSGGADLAAMADPVPGTMLVTAAAMPSRNALYHMSRITGVISAEGVAPTAVQYGGLIRTSLWPSPGKQIPVIVDRADPTKFAIQWDEMGTAEDSALGQAEALAAAMRARQDEPPR